MRLTERKLRNIIREEIVNLREADASTVGDVMDRYPNAEFVDKFDPRHRTFDKRYSNTDWPIFIIAGDDKPSRHAMVWSAPAKSSDAPVERLQ
jgi:hypothetical protein